MIRNILKKTAKQILPVGVYSSIKQKWNYWARKKKLKAAYRYDLKRFSKYSDTLNTDSSQKLVGKIIREYHVVEKGLTMPEPRLGFGREVLITLAEDCIEYVNRYNTDEPQLLHAIGVILEYETFHSERKFQLSDDIQLWINKIKQLKLVIPACPQKEITKEDFFKYTESTFPEFAKSRASVRNYLNEDIPLKKITQALAMAQTTPSQCNRQCWRSYVYTDKNQIGAILQAQGGNRGFGHLANKLIVITSELGVFNYEGERNGAYIDGGMYAMNLLYALHYEKIAACILNCSNSIEKDIKLRELCKIKKTEVFIAMIVCGIPPEQFKIATSKRYEIDKTNTIVNH
ncbi:MAG: nitroreductase family protein [Bacteroides sp.]|jgi:nitroreductase|nr:nitroreductase family protein [Bacteroides sp.]